MSAEEIRAKVIELIEETKRSDAPVEDGSRLAEDLGFDLHDQIELDMDIEEELGFLIDDEAFDKAKTVGDLIRAAQEAVRRQAEQEAV